MNRMIAYLASLMASAIGWRLGQHFGIFAGLALSSVAAGAALYFTSRILHEYLDS